MNANTRTAVRARLVRLARSVPGVGVSVDHVRARVEERQARRNRILHACKALQSGAPIPTGAELAYAMRERIARRRGHDTTPKRAGTLHIFLAFALTNWEAVLPRSLEPFGRVTTFEWRSRGYDDTAPDWLKRRDGMNAEMLEAFRVANTDQPVDVVVGYLSGHNTDPRVLVAMAEAGAAIVNFCWDDKVRFPGPIVGGRYVSPAAIASVIDLNLTNAPGSVVAYAAHGGAALFWPEAAHPEVHRPYPIPFDIDVSFVGARYGWRPGFISRLERLLGTNIECFGRGWPNGPLSSEDMIRLYSRSRINLGFGGVGHSRRLMCIKGRDFEVPMSGGLYLTQYNPELHGVYDLGREIVTYIDEYDCALQVRRLLADQGAAAAIREAGRRRALKDHTYESRWRQVLELLGLLEAAGDEHG